MTGSDQSQLFGPSSPARHHLDRAIGDLRRGLPLLIEGEVGQILVAASELISDPIWQDFLALGSNFLALSGERAGVLHITGKSMAAITIALDKNWSAAAITALADPVHDLALPLRGPFYPTEVIPQDLTASAVRIQKLARLLPAAVVVQSSSDQLHNFVETRGLLKVKASDIDQYERQSAENLSVLVDARIPLEGAETVKVVAFRPTDGGLEHLALVIGNPDLSEPVLIRLHSACLTGDVLGSLRCDCGPQMRGAVTAISEAGGGILLYLAQEGRGIGLINKLRAYNLQDQGFDTVDANIRLGFGSDERLFLPAANILKLLKVNNVRLMTNNPDKVAQLESHGIKVTERVAHQFPANPHNQHYLATKAKKSGHYL